MILDRQQQVLANHVSTLSSIHDDMAAIALEQINEFGGVFKGFESLWTDGCFGLLFVWASETLVEAHVSPAFKIRNVASKWMV